MRPNKPCDVCGKKIPDQDAVVEFVEKRPVMINGAPTHKRWETGGSACWPCWSVFRGWGDG